MSPIRVPAGYQKPPEPHSLDRLGQMRRRPIASLSASPLREPAGQGIPLNCSKVWPLAKKTREPMKSPRFTTTASPRMTQPTARLELR